MKNFEYGLTFKEYMSIKAMLNGINKQSQGLIILLENLQEFKFDNIPKSLSKDVQTLSILLKSMEHLLNDINILPGIHIHKASFQIFNIHLNSEVSRKLFKKLNIQKEGITNLFDSDTLITFNYQQKVKIETIKKYMNKLGLTNIHKALSDNTIHYASDKVLKNFSKFKKDVLIPNKQSIGVNTNLSYFIKDEQYVIYQYQVIIIQGLEKKWNTLD